MSVQRPFARQPPGITTSSAPSGRRQEQLGRLVRVSRLEQRGGEPPRGVPRDHALVEVLASSVLSPRGRERELDVAGRECPEAAVEEIPGKPLHVVKQAGVLDGSVEHFGRLGQATLHPERRTQHGEDEWEEISLPGRAPELERALGMATGGLEEVEIHLRGREMGESVEASREFVVGQRVNDSRSLLAMCPRKRDRAAQRRRERAHGERRRDQGAIAQRRRGARRAIRPDSHLLVCAPEEGVDGQLDHERRRLARVGVLELLERPLESCVRLLVSAEKVLDTGRRRNEPHALPDRLFRRDRHALEQDAVAVGEPTGGGQGAGTSQQEVDALLEQTRLGKEA